MSWNAPEETAEEFIYKWRDAVRAGSYNAMEEDLEARDERNFKQCRDKVHELELKILTLEVEIDGLKND